jgi:hypothetical protein
LSRIILVLWIISGAVRYSQVVMGPLYEPAAALGALSRPLAEHAAPLRLVAAAPDAVRLLDEQGVVQAGALDRAAAAQEPRRRLAPPLVLAPLAGRGRVDVHGVDPAAGGLGGPAGVEPQ